MIDGFLVPELKDIDYLTPSAPYPMVPAGITVHEGAIYRYSIPTDEQPTLLIADYIPDHNGNFINPGYYQLALSDDREFLYLIESRELKAIIPVFKIAENKNELRKLYASKKELTRAEKRERAKKKRKEKMQEVINKKYAVSGATPPQEYVHMQATIDYIKEGEYYLIMYEKGYIRAWGAIKR